jgi:hypothetical protein
MDKILLFFKMELAVGKGASSNLMKEKVALEEALS